MNKVAKQFLVIGITIVALMAVTLAWLWKSLPPMLPWFYSLPWGEQQLADKNVLIFVLGGALGLLIITRMISVWVGKDDDAVETTIMAGGVTAIILLGATFFRVMQMYFDA